MDEEKIPTVDAIGTINNVARNVAGHALAWNFMRAHWEDIKDGQVDFYSLVYLGRTIYVLHNGLHNAH